MSVLNAIKGSKELLNKIESGKIRAISRYNYNDSHDNVVNNFMVFKHLLYDSTVSKQQQRKGSLTIKPLLPRLPRRIKKR